MRFGEMLRAARGDLYQTQLHKMSGVPHGNISLMERGFRYPEPATLRRLCEVLPLDFEAAWTQIGREKAGKGGADDVAAG